MSKESLVDKILSGVDFLDKFRLEKDDNAAFVYVQFDNNKFCYLDSTANFVFDFKDANKVSLHFRNWFYSGYDFKSGSFSINDSNGICNYIKNVFSQSKSEMKDYVSLCNRFLKVCGEGSDFDSLESLEVEDDANRILVDGRWINFKDSMHFKDGYFGVEAHAKNPKGGNKPTKFLKYYVSLGGGEFQDAVVRCNLKIETDDCSTASEAYESWKNIVFSYKNRLSDIMSKY